MSDTNIYNLFKDSNKNVILTLSMDATLEDVVVDGVAVVWQSVTNIYFLLKYPSILILNIM